jgi:DNA-binding response OmpR family regulator
MMDRPQRILVIEDHPQMGQLILSLLQDLHYEAVLACTLEKAELCLADGDYDLITLDVNLPDGNGLTFCARLREQGVTAPIIILTTEISAESVVRGLECGASDYLKKPIEPAELKARLRGHLRRLEMTTRVLEFKELKLDLDKRTASYQGKPVELSGRQLDLLACFLRRPEVVITREQLIQSLGREAEIFDRTIDSHMSQLRKKLKDAAIKSPSISSIYGVGYRIE